MFLVVNTTKQHLSLGDLKVVIPPGQSLDLDNVADRKFSDSSPSVRKAIVSGYLRVVNKDHPSQNSTSLSIDDIKKLLKENSDTTTINDLARSISELKNLITSMPTSQVVQVVSAPAVSSSVSQIANVSIDEPQAENLVAIHEKVMSRMTSGMSMNIGTDTSSNASIDDVKKNLDELEGLI